MKTKLFQQKEPANPNSFYCLEGKDVITAQVSDHHPVIHNGILFWNIMMQGKLRKRDEIISYNNGFGIVETDDKYIARLKKIARVVAEISYRYPTIVAINLCEGPIAEQHVNAFLDTLYQFKSMQRFFSNNKISENLYKPTINGMPNWGLMMLVETDYKVSEIPLITNYNSTVFHKLANRFQLWQLSKNGKEQYLALAHFPFGGNEYVTKRKNLSNDGIIYSHLINDLMKKYVNEHLIFCADFNFNPYLISKWKDRILDQITHNNSILLTQQSKNGEFKQTAVTVDGILMSIKEKQRYYSLRFNPGLFNRLIKENDLGDTVIKNKFK